MSGIEEQGGGSWELLKNGTLKRLGGTASHPDGDAPREADGTIIGGPVAALPAPPVVPLLPGVPVAEPQEG